MQLLSVLLCDFAQVRDGLLMVSSGAVTRLFRAGLPATLSLMVAVVIEVPRDQTNTVHTLTSEVFNRSGEVLAVGRATFEVGDEDLFPHEIQQVSVVLSLKEVTATSWGTHQIRVDLDGQSVRVLTFYVVPSADPIDLDLSDGAEVAGERLRVVHDGTISTGTGNR